MGARKKWVLPSYFICTLRELKSFKLLKTQQITHVRMDRNGKTNLITRLTLWTSIHLAKNLITHVKKKLQISMNPYLHQTVSFI